MYVLLCVSECKNKWGWSIAFPPGHLSGAGWPGACRWRWRQPGEWKETPFCSFIVQVDALVSDNEWSAWLASGLWRNVTCIYLKTWGSSAVLGEYWFGNLFECYRLKRSMRLVIVRGIANHQHVRDGVYWCMSDWDCRDVSPPYFTVKWNTSAPIYRCHLVISHSNGCYISTEWVIDTLQNSCNQPHTHPCLSPFPPPVHGHCWHVLGFLIHPPRGIPTPIYRHASSR